MENDNLKSNQQPAKKRAPKKKAQKKAAMSGGTFGTSLVQRTNRITDKTGDQFRYVWSEPHKAKLRWMQSVFDPATGTAGVPNSAGSFELFTDLWRTTQLGSSVADANGDAYVGVAADSWIESGNYNGTPTTECRVVGYTSQGNQAIYTDGTVPIGSSLPTVGAAVIAGELAMQAQLPGDNWSSVTRGRLVGQKLTVWSDEAQTTAKGEVVLASTVNPAGSVLGGRLNGCPFSSIVGSNKQSVASQIASFPNWRSGEAISAVSLPAEDMAYDMVNYPAAGYTSVPFFTLAAMARGMTPGAKFMWKLEQLYESESNVSNRVDKQPNRTVHVGIDELSPYISSAGPLRASNPSSSLAIVPYVNTLQERDPQAAAAIASHPTISRIPTPSGGSFLDTLKGLGKAAATAAKTTGVLKRVPVIGDFLDSALNGITKLFGF